MKRAYVRPTMVGERFVANEYVAACGATHEAPSTDDFVNGFMIDTRPFHDHTAQKVIIWTEDGTNVHCTTDLDKNTWETAKS